MTRSRYRFLGNGAPYFLTMTINDWLPVFTRPETVAVLFESWRTKQSCSRSWTNCTITRSNAAMWTCPSTGAGPVPGSMRASRG